KKFLYPKPIKQRQISNAKMLRMLSDYGDDGSKPREITFHMIFTARTRAMDFLSEAVLHGFQYKDLVKEAAPEGMVLPRFHLTITKKMPFAVDLLEVVDAFLLEQAERYEAVYKNTETEILEES
ncbi:MAG TPA: ribonuclease E inhibitor RraB, partial [Clostridiales bacterium]|nr:ribonuclease E inhibitor RraB [Clostridiales bacterium]